MNFNLTLSKQAQEVIFSRKNKKLLHPTLLFNNIPLSNSLFQTHLGLTLDNKVKLLETCKRYCQKTRKLWAFYVDLNKFCQGNLFSLYIKLS